MGGGGGGGRADVQIIQSVRKRVYPADSLVAPDTESADYTIVVLTNATPPTAAAFSSEIVDFLTGWLALPKRVKLKRI